MKEPGAFEILDKQEARVEAANALLFLKGQAGPSADDPAQEEEPEERNENAMLEESSSSSLSPSMDEEDKKSEHGNKRTKFGQTVNLDDVLRALKKENRVLRESVEKMSLSENSLKNNGEEVQFYTGLPNYFVLETVMWLLAPHMNGMKNVKLSKFQYFLLMRLRLDLRNQDLAYSFGVKVSTLIKTVHHMINILSSTLVPMAVFWPSRAELRKNLPEALRASHPDCTVIADCFTVPFEEPAPCSNCCEKQKCPQTVEPGGRVLKYLVGVARQGMVTFVSRGVLGNITDRSLAEGCGFLFKLLPGDVVLATRDLDIRESVAARGAQFKIAGVCPEVADVSESVQQHVERVVSMVKQQYSMLSGPIESPFTAVTERSSNISTFDKIVQVACALNNLCISAAPLE